jgi:very-short-patch-repair endonuclease
MSQSELEAEFERLLRIYGVPGYEREWRFAAPDRQWRFDFAWPDIRCACEIDGGQWVARGGRHNTDADRWKLNYAAARDWVVLRFSRAMLGEPDRCIDLVKRALKARGRDNETV